MVNQNEILEIVYQKLELKGYKARIVSADHINDLRNDIQKLHEQNLLDLDFYEEYKSYFEFVPDVNLSNLESIIVIAIPQPSYEAVFQLKNRILSLQIPPTYLHVREVIKNTKVLLNDILNPFDYRVEYAVLPVKTLAVRSGLAEYGKNNITYVEGMGSFHRLCAFYSDFRVDLEHDNWNELKAMEMCEKCDACRHACPTGAIASDRFLLHVERCLTFHNEHPNDVVFPEWIDPSWHNCLVGCLHCQRACPADKKVIGWTERGPEFTEKETQMILERYEFEKLPEETQQKVMQYEFVHYYNVFSRNLSVFLKS